MANRLANATSPYLLQHAENPVDWWEWGEDAFAAARQRDVPVIVKTLESVPKDAMHWSTGSMAAASGLTQSAVSRIWRAFGLQPHRHDSWKLSKDPQFVDQGGRRRALPRPSRTRGGAVGG